MTKGKFDIYYKHLGGFKKLKQMMYQEEPINKIAKKFGVGKNAVRLWCIDIFGKNYDPRKSRREKIVKEIIGYAKSHSEKQLKEKYIKKSKYYYYIALSECYSKGIYKK